MKRIVTHPLFWLQCICLIILYAGYAKFMNNPNGYLLNQWGDGAKNYFTPAWYIQYDEGIHFSGMNHPFGEHITYTDNQPVLSVVLNSIDNHLFPVAQYTVGVLNILMFLAFVLCAIFLYKICTHYQLPALWAVSAAIIITFMNPQSIRMQAHYALSYSCFIPLIWWLAILAEKRNYRFIYVAGIIAIVTTFSFIHLYYALISLLFFAACFIVKVIRRNISKKEMGAYFFILFIPVIILFTFLHFTDNISDRPATPYGFFSYEASPQSVFLPGYGVIADFLYKDLDMRKGNDEGYAYVGLVCTIVFIISLVVYVKKALQQKKLFPAVVHMPPGFNIYLLAAFLILLFSFAVPFNLGLAFLLDYIPFIKQFRSLGRFAWVFYFIFTVYAAIVLYQQYQVMQKKNKIPAIIMLCLLFLITIYDVQTVCSRNSKLVHNNARTNPFYVKDAFWQQFLASNNYQTEDFQALLSLGFFLNGSEKLYIDRSGYDMGRAMEIAYQTGLPLINGMMSRSSLSQSLQLAQTVGHSTIDKTIRNLLNQKDILIVTNEKELSAQEKYLITKAKFIGQHSNLKLYAMPVSALENTQESLVSHFVNNRNMMYYDSVHQYYAEQPIALLYKNNFDSLTAPDAFEGTGAFFRESGSFFMADIPVEVQETIWIEISFWQKAYQQTTAFPSLQVSFYDNNAKLLKSGSVNPKFSSDIIGDWVRGSENFDVPPACKRITLQTNTDKMIHIDNLVVRHTAYDIFYDVLNPAQFTFNNYPVGK